MTSALTPLGVPGQIADLVSSLFQPHGNAKHGFHSHFGSAMNGAASGTAAQTQLTSLISNGTPISTVVDTLANQIATSVQQTLPGSQLTSGASRTMLVGSIKAALSPPSNAPPGDAAQQVAALAQQLQSWLSGVARVADRQGQQNDISGQVLDANSAREIPAQKQDPTSTSTSLPSSAVDVNSLVQSLLASVAASLSGAKTAPNLQANASSSLHTQAASAALVPAGISQLARGAQGPDQTAQPSPPSSDATAQAAGSVPNPSDLVARMLARAAGVDAAHNAELATVATDAPENPQLPRMAGTAILSESPSATAAKLTILLTDAVAAGTQAGQDNPAGQDGARDFASSAGAFATLPAKSAVRTDATTLFTTTSLPTTPGQSSSLAAPATTGASVDPNAIAEQVVKSMAMRTGQDGTSEVRMRLEPESLGTVTLKLTVEGNNVSATAVAQNADVRNALLANHQQLARSLADAGLKLTGFTVNLSSGNQNQHQRGQNSGSGRRYAVHEAAAPSEETQGIAGAGPALLSGSTLGLLSYLA